VCPKVTAQDFNKYRRDGAYHWRETSRSLRRRDARTTGRYRIMVDWVREALPPVGAILCADLGTGDGALLAWLRTALPETRVQLLGLDAMQEGLNLARARIGAVDVATAEVERLPLSDSSVHIAVVSEVIEHLADPEALLGEVHRVLVPGGTMVLSTPVRLYERPRDPNHVQEFFPGELATLLCRRFEAVEVRPIQPVAYVERYRRRLHFACLRISFWKYIYNIADLLGRNPFLRPAPDYLPLYMGMVARCRKAKFKR
jgi:SAM-dependent methyltransferase